MKIINLKQHGNNNTTPEEVETPASTPIQTSVVTENNLSESYNTTFNTVKIKNETNFDLTNSILEPNISYSDLKNIIIFHTHTCESYTQTEANKYTPSGNFRTIDLNYSVAKVRKCFNRLLKSKRIQCHTQSYFS